MRTHATYEVRRLIDSAGGLADESADVDTFVEQFHDRLLDRTFPCPPGQTWDLQRSVAATSREVLPAVTGLLLLCGHDPNQALIEAASFGRDADTIASVLGCLVGALHGASALDSAWIQRCEDANADFFAEAADTGTGSFTSTADQLVEALRTDASTVHARADRLEQRRNYVGNPADRRFNFGWSDSGFNEIARRWQSEPPQSVGHWPATTGGLRRGPLAA